MGFELLCKPYGTVITLTHSLTQTVHSRQLIQGHQTTSSALLQVSDVELDLSCPVHRPESPDGAPPPPLLASHAGPGSAASPAVAFDRVGAACTLHDSRSTWFLIMSNKGAVISCLAVQSTPIIQPRRDGNSKGWARATVLSLDALARPGTSASSGWPDRR